MTKKVTFSCPEFHYLTPHADDAIVGSDRPQNTTRAAPRDGHPRGSNHGQPMTDLASNPTPVSATLAATLTSRGTVAGTRTRAVTHADWLSDFRNTLQQSNRTLGNLAIDQIQNAASMPHLVSLLSSDRITALQRNGAHEELAALPQTPRTARLTTASTQHAEKNNLRKLVMTLATEKAYHCAANHLAHAHREQRPLSPDERHAITEAFRELQHWAAHVATDHHALHASAAHPSLIDDLHSIVADIAPKPAERSRVEKIQDVIRHWLMYGYARGFFIDNPVIMEGAEKVPKAGPGLIVLNHGIPIFDTPMGLRQIEHAVGRPMLYMIDKALIYKSPILGLTGSALSLFCLYHGLQTNNPSLVAVSAFTLGLLGWVGALGIGVNISGCVPASPSHLKDGLNKHMLASLLPGGMRAALRSPEEGMVTRWQKSDGTLRDGVGRYALETNTFVMPVSCSAAEPASGRLYESYPNQVSHWVYRHFKLPFIPTAGRIGQYLPAYLKPLFVEFPFFGFPKPNLIRHVVGDGFYPPAMPEDATFDKHDPQFLELAAIVTRQIVDALHDGLEYGERKDNPDYAAKTTANFMRYQSRIQSALHIHDQLHAMVASVQDDQPGRTALITILKELCTATYTKPPRQLSALSFAALQAIAHEKLRSLASLSPLQMNYLWDRSLLPTLSQAIGKANTTQLISQSAPNACQRALQTLERFTALIEAHQHRYPGMMGVVDITLKLSNSDTPHFEALKNTRELFNQRAESPSVADYQQRVYQPLAALCTAISENWFNISAPLLDTLHVSLGIASLSEQILDSVQQVSANREALLAWVNTLPALNEDSSRPLFKALTISLCDHFGEALSHPWHSITEHHYLATLLDRLHQLSKRPEPCQAEALKKLAKLLELHGSATDAQFMWHSNLSTIQALTHKALRGWLNTLTNEENTETKLILSPLTSAFALKYPGWDFDQAVQEILHPNGNRPAAIEAAKVLTGLLWSVSTQPYPGHQIVQWLPPIQTAQWPAHYAQNLQRLTTTQHYSVAGTEPLPQIFLVKSSEKETAEDTSGQHAVRTAIDHAHWNATHIDKLEPAHYQRGTRIQGPLVLGPALVQKPTPKLPTPPSILSAISARALQGLQEPINTVKPYVPKLKTS